MISKEFHEHEKVNFVYVCEGGEVLIIVPICVRRLYVLIVYNFSAESNVII